MTVRSSRPLNRPTTLAFAAVLGVSAFLIPTTSSTAAPQPAAPQPAAPSPVAWGACAAGDIGNVPPAERSRFSCANYVVPLDYDRPNRGTINLALMRRAANDQANRIGSLFLNPGGPGGSGYRFPTITQLLFQPAVADRFDVIGFDPRGVARSTPLRCFATQEDADEVFGRMALLPITRQEERDTLDAMRDYGRFCDRFAGPLLEEMSTENVARDLDRLRAAVGDKQLNYLGFSYGTLLGATYVNLFPNRSRAIILDGNVDPNLRLHDGLEYDRQRTSGFEIALDAFLPELRRGRLGVRVQRRQSRARSSTSCAPTCGRPGRSPCRTAPWWPSTRSPTRVAGTLYDLTALADLAAALQEVYDVIHPSGRDAASAPRPPTQSVQAMLRQREAGQARHPAGHAVHVRRLLRRGQLHGQAVPPPGRPGAVDRRPVGAADAHVRPVPGVGRPGDLPELAAGPPRRLQRTVEPPDAQPGAGVRQLLRPGHAVRVRPADDQAARQRAAGQRGRVRAHHPGCQHLRRHDRHQLPDRPDGAQAWHRVPAEHSAVPTRLRSPGATRRSLPS